ncbi:MAG TPA: hypothetical protein VMP10_03110 [Chloroflexota bacterium]|nr:hypothetical protein [Chloroflexota bacterium]
MKSGGHFDESDANWYEAVRCAGSRSPRMAHEDAFGAGQNVGQESFLTADDIRELANRAGVARDSMWLSSGRVPRSAMVGQRVDLEAQIA